MLHTWAVFFLRHLANVSSMVLLSINWFWLCPQSGARVRSHAVRRRLFIVLMTATHISPNVFSLWNFLSNIHILLLMIHSTSFILIIHHIHTNNYTILFTWHFHTFTSSDPHVRQAALGPLCPIHLPRGNPRLDLGSTRPWVSQNSGV
jgi:hypothetical protein